MYIKFDLTKRLRGPQDDLKLFKKSISIKMLKTHIL